MYWPNLLKRVWWKRLFCFHGEWVHKGTWTHEWASPPITNSTYCCGKCGHLIVRAADSASEVPK